MGCDRFLQLISLLEMCSVSTNGERASPVIGYPVDFSVQSLSGFI